MPDIGLIHYCEGSGHAMRMIAIADELEQRGLTTDIIGGGTGEKFLEMNREVEASPAEITTYEDIQKKGFIKALTKLPSDFFRRLSDLRAWIREEDPEYVVADGPVAHIAAVLERKKVYAVLHSSWQVPEALHEKTFSFLYFKIYSLYAEEIFYPAIWEDIDPPRAQRVGPTAPEGEEEELDFDILIVPTTLKDTTDGFAEELEGYDVKVVGSDDWEIQPSLQPYIEEADVVICGGYSTMMEASVAGTSVVMVPESSEQRGVSSLLERYEGFRTYSGDIREDVEEVGHPEARENGASEIAERITADFKT